jgi:hypothetical protein
MLATVVLQISLGDRGSYCGSAEESLKINKNKKDHRFVPQPGKTKKNI